MERQPPPENPRVIPAKIVKEPAAAGVGVVVSAVIFAVLVVLLLMGAS